MIKYKEFFGESLETHIIARTKALSKLNKWLKENDIKIIGMQWKVAPGLSGGWRAWTSEIEIMYQETHALRNSGGKSSYDCGRTHK